VLPNVLDNTVATQHEALKYDNGCGLNFCDFFQIFPILRNRTIYKTYAISALNVGDNEDSSTKPE
jgi:hypothetical protein